MLGRTFLLFALASLSLGACTSTPPSENREAGIQVSDAWLKALPGMLTPMPMQSANAESIAPPALSVFMTIRNKGNQNDRLVQVECAVAQRVELHNMEMRNGQMMMVPVPNIEIPKGQEVILKSGSYHLMLFGVTRELKVADTISMTLKFVQAGSVPVQVVVRQP